MPEQDARIPNHDGEAASIPQAPDGPLQREPAGRRATARDARLDSQLASAGHAADLWPMEGVPFTGCVFRGTVLRKLAHKADRSEAMLKVWTDFSFAASELLGGPSHLSFEEAAEAVQLPPDVFGAAVLDIFYRNDGTSFHPEGERYSPDDLIRLLSALPAWLRD